MHAKVTRRSCAHFASLSRTSSPPSPSHFYESNQVLGLRNLEGHTVPVPARRSTNSHGRSARGEDTVWSYLLQVSPVRSFSSQLFHTTLALNGKLHVPQISRQSTNTTGSPRSRRHWRHLLSSPFFRGGLRAFGALYYATKRAFRPWIARMRTSKWMLSISISLSFAFVPWPTCQDSHRCSLLPSWYHATDRRPFCGASIQWRPLI